MVTEEQVFDVVQKCNDDGRKDTFAEFIAKIFTGKFIEIYLSDSYEEVSMEQISQNYPAVFCGKVVSAYRECLVINSVFINKSHKMELGNLMFISERAIKAINQIDGNGTMEDMFLRSRESLVIKNVFVDNGSRNHKPITPHGK
jgi:hypothetical protein